MNIKQIDTRHGTANQHSFSHGNCLPYSGVPFGMNYFAAQTTDQKGSWWFHPEDRTFQGYRLTHQPSPWMGDFSHLLLTPVSGTQEKTSLLDIQSSYRPEQSTFSPTHIQIEQMRYQINSTLIPSMYGGILTIDYKQKQNGLILTLPGRYQVKQVTDRTISCQVINFSGSEDKNFTFYFILRLDKPLITPLENQKGVDGSLLLSFGDSLKQTVRLGTSFISEEQALLNLKREEILSAHTYLEKSTSEWQGYFDRVQVEHTDFKHTETFYHNLYRMFLFPQTFYEINASNQKIHYDTFNKEVKKGSLYTNNGFWDTYKTVYPFYSLIAQEKYIDMLEGFLNSYEETGFLPKWLSPDERGLMPGTLIDAVIADAAVKGIGENLMERFLEAMKKAATIQSDNSNYGRQGTYDYLKYGYVPSNHHESVNHTLDYAYSDFCISKVAETLNKQEDKELYQKQSLNYKHIFDSKTGFMRAKNKEGKFRNHFLDTRWGEDYAEGSAWQSSFAVYQDFAGLINQYDSPKQFEEKIIQLCNQSPIFNVDGYGFEIHEMSEMAALEFGQLAISNQPSFHYPFLFSYIGKPEMAQPLLKQLLTQTFDATPTGYPGDEDNGSMAGWYIFNSLGFYPVTPGSGEYVIGMPLVKKAVLKLSNGKELIIKAETNLPQQQFIHQINFNEKQHEPLFFNHHDLMEGGEIAFHLGIVPNPKEVKIENLPFSLSKK